MTALNAGRSRFVGQTLKRSSGFDAERLGIRHQRLDPHRRLQRLDRQKLCVQGVEKQLQRRQPLLTVDDRSLLHLARLLLNLLQHDRSEKVRMMLLRVVG